jgi:hypothetical protein
MWTLQCFETTDKEKPDITGVLRISNASSYVHVTWSFWLLQGQDFSTYNIVCVTHFYCRYLRPNNMFGKGLLYFLNSYKVRISLAVVVRCILIISIDHKTHHSAVSSHSSGVEDTSSLPGCLPCQLVNSLTIWRRNFLFKF